MRPSEDLFHLIKSLSKSEKRYFKLMASVPRGEKNYIRLFDFLGEMPEFDEDAVRSHFAGERFINQLNVTKHYLYELILKSLRAYHTDYSAKSQITDLLKSAEILREKGLSEQGLRLVEKAIGIAKEHEEMLLLLQALLARNMYISTDVLSTPEIDARFDELCNVVERQRNILDYERLTIHMNSIQYSCGPRTEEDYLLLERCRWHPLMSSCENARSARALYLHLSVLMHYNAEHAKPDEALEIVTRQTELLENNPALIADRPIPYLANLANRVVLTMQLGDVHAYRAALAYFKDRGEMLLADNRLSSRRIRARLFVTYHVSLMDFYYLYGMFEESAELLESMEHGLKEHAAYIEDYDVMRLIGLAACIEFGRGRFSSALDFNNRMLRVPEPTGPLQSYHHHGRLFNLIIHYELGNIDLLSYLIPTTSRYFASRGRLERFERTLLKFLKRLLKTSSTKRGELLHDFRNELLELINDPGSRNAFSCFCYIEWVTGKIENRPLSKVLQESRRFEYDNSETA